MKNKLILRATEIVTNNIQYMYDTSAANFAIRYLFCSILLGWKKYRPNRFPLIMKIHSSSLNVTNDGLFKCEQTTNQFVSYC